MSPLFSTARFFSRLFQSNNSLVAGARFRKRVVIGRRMQSAVAETLESRLLMSSTHLSFGTQPTDTVAGDGISTITVSILDGSNSVVTSDHSFVTLKVATGPGASAGELLFAVPAVNGIATFTGLSLTEAGNYVLTATDGLLTPNVSSSFAITPDAASQLAITAQPSSAVAGATLSTFAAAVEDQFGNVVTTDNANITISLNGGASLGGTLTVAANSGVANFSDLSVTRSGSYTISAAQGGLTVATSDTLTIAPAIANHLVFSTSPVGTTAGSTLAGVTVAIEDQYNNIISADGSTVTLSVASGSGILGGTLHAVAVNGVATFADLSLANAGAYTLGATDGGLSTATSGSFTIAPAAATHLVFTQQSGDVGVGALGTYAVSVEDAFGNVVTSNHANVTIGLTAGSGVLTGTLTVAASNGVATFSDLATYTAGRLSLSASNGSLSSAVSNAFNVTAAAASQLAFSTTPGGVNAGGLSTVVVSVEDPYGNTVTSDSSNVTLSINGGGTLGGTLTIAASAGIATFSGLSVHTPGTFTLGAADGSLSSATSNSFTVAAATATHLVFTQSPGNGAAGLLGTVSASVEDQFGNVVTTDNSMVGIVLATGQGTLLGTLNVQAVNGVAVFNTLALHTPGTFTLGAADGSLTTATTGSFLVTPGAAAKVGFNSQPASTIAGATLSAFSAAIEDQFGNIVTTSSANIRFAVTTGGSTVNLVVAASNGVATLSGVALVKAGSASIHATSSGLTAASSSTFSVTPAAPFQLVVLQQPSTATAGTTFSSIYVAVEDQYNNIVTTANSQVTLVLDSGNSAINGTTTVAAINGVATFSDLSTNKVGTFTTHVTDGDLVAATLGSFIITPAAASQVVFTQQTGNGVAGSTLSTVQVSVEDPFGNVVTTDSSNITVALGGGNATLGGTLTMAASSGVATFTDLSLTKTGNYTLSAADSSLAAGTSTTFTITPDVATHLGFVSAPSSVAAGAIGTIAVAVEDQFGNIVATDTSSVTALVFSGSGTLGGNLTVTAIAGVATFTDLSLHTPDSYTLSFSDGALTHATSGAFNVTPAAPTQLVVTQQPANGTAGALGTLQVSVEDQYGNIVTNADSSGITLSLHTGSGNFTGTVTANTTLGVATFNNLSLTTAGTYSLHAVDGELIAANSGNFIITHDVAAQLVFTTPPSDSTAGTLAAVVVAVEDQYGNIVTNDASTVTISHSGPGSLGGTSSTTAVNGVATFTNLQLHTAGSERLSNSDGLLSTSLTELFTVTPGVATHLAVTQQPENSVAGGTISAINVSVEDQYGNVVTSDHSAVTIALATGNATLGGTQTISAQNGVATFSGLSLTKTGSYTFGVADGILGTDTSASMTVAPAAATHLVFTSQPGNITAGGAFSSFTVAVEDQYNNIVATDTSAITISRSTGNGTVTGTLTENVVSGIATFADLSLTTANVVTLVATDGSLETDTSLSLTISPGVATHLAFLNSPTGGVTAGALNTVSVAVEDQYNNILATDSSTVTIALGSGSGTLGGTLTGAAVNGVAVFSDLSLHHTGSFTLAASDGALTHGTSASFSIIPAAPTQIVIFSGPGNSLAGALGSVSFAIEDPFGNIVTAASPDVTISLGSDAATLAGTRTVTAINGVASFSNLSITTSGAYTLNLSSEGLPIAATGSFIVSSNVATHLAITAQPDATTIAGVTMGGVVIAVEDQYNNLVTTGTPNIVLSLNGNASLGGSLTIAATNGVALFSDLSVPTSGTYTLTASDAALTTATTSTFAITPNVATHLAYTAGSTTAIAGNLFGFTVAVEDQFNNIVTTDSSTVTLSVATGPGALFGTQAAAVSNGIATFSTLSIHTAGAYTFTVADGSLATVISGTLTITPTTATKLLFTTQPIGDTAGSTLAAVVVSVEDQYGNVVTTNTSTISLLVNTGGSSFTLNTPATAGVSTFSGFAFTRTGNFTLSATDSGLASTISNLFTITPNVATHLAFVAGPANVAAGNLTTMTVAVEDQFNNIVTGDSSSVTLALASGNATLGGTLITAVVNGVATFSTASIHTPGTFSLSAADGSLAPNTSATFMVVPSAATHLVVTQQPADTAAGTLGTITAAVEDQFGNIVTSDTSTVALAVASGNATLGGTVSAPAINGVATFSFATLTKTGNYTLSLTDGLLTGATTTSFAITPAAATHLAFITPPADVTAGTLGTITAAIEDQFNNIVTTDTSTVALSLTEYGALGGTVSTLAVGGVATFSAATVTQAGSYRLSVADGLLTGATSDVFTISPGTATHLVVTTSPGTGSAGALGTVTVAVEDQYDNLVTTDSSTITLALNGNAALGGTVTVAATNGIATFNNLSLHTAGTYTLTATDAALVSGNSTTFTVTPAAATQVVFTQQTGNVTAGALGSTALAIEDQYGNLVTTDSSALTIAIHTGSAPLGGTLTVNAAAGLASFSDLSITKSGNYTLIVADGSLASAVGSTFTVSAGAATHIAFATAPGTTSAGNLNPNRVAIEDQYNNFVTSDSSTVTLTLNGNSTLGGTLTAAAVNGVATFLNLSVHTTGIYTITAADGSFAPTTSGSFTILPAAANHLAITTQPTNHTAGTLSSITVAVEDQYNNVVTSNASTVALSLNGNATLGGTTVVSAQSGTATFSAASLTKSGSYTLTVSDGSLTSATTTSFAITPGTPTHLVIATQPTAHTAGTLGTVTVAVEDQYNNIVTSNASIVALSLNGNATLGGTTSVAAQAGIATFSAATLTKTGNYTLTGSDGSLANATTTSFAITPDVPTHLAVITQPADHAAGTLGTFAVAVEDQYNNIVTSDASTVLLSLNGNATLGGTTALTAQGGIATFSAVTLTKAGSYSIVAADGALTPSTTGTFSISPAAATHLVITQQPTGVTAGTLGTITVAVEDAYNNIVTSNASTVALSLNGNTTLGGTTSVSAQAGLATFSAASLTKTGNYTLTLSDGSLTSATTTSFAITPAVANHLAITQQPASTVAGTLNTLTVAVEDQYNNLVTSNTSAVALSLNGNATLAGTTTVSAQGGLATFSGLAITKSGSYTFAINSGSLTTSTSAFTISPAPAAAVVFTTPLGDQVAGTLGSISVSVVDPYNNLVTDNTSAVTLALASGNGSLGGNPTVNAVGGVATFTGLTLTTTGSYTLSATASSINAATSSPFTILPASAAKLVYLQSPASSVVGTLGTVTIAVEDQFNNIVTSDNSNVTVALSGNTPLGGAGTVAAVNGIATFSNLTTTNSGAYTLTASDGSLSAISAGFTVAAKLAITSQPTTAIAGTLGTITVTIQDSDGHTLTSDNSAVTLALNTNLAGTALEGTSTVNALNGIATFSNVSITTTGAYTLTASDGAITAAGNTPITIAAGAPASMVFVQGPSSATAGVRFGSSFIVRLLDQYGNTATNDKAPVTLSAPASPSGAILSGTLTATPTNGLVTFSNVITKTAGQYALTAATGSVTQTSGSVTVAPAAPKNLFFSTQPITTAAGTSFSVVATITDSFGNLATNSSAPVTLTIASSTARGSILHGTLIASAVNGVATFSGLSITSVGNYSLKASAAGLAGTTSARFAIAAAAPAQLAFINQPKSAVAGVSLGTSLTVAVRDQYGNLCTTDASSVALDLATSGAPRVGSPINLAGIDTVSAVNGIATFTGISVHLVGSYVLAAADGSLTTATSSPFTITPAAASTLMIIQQPSNGTINANIAPAITVQLFDPFGNLATTNKSTVKLAIATGPDGGKITGAAKAVIGGTATFASLKLNRAGAYTLLVTDGALATDTSDSFSIQ